MKIGETQRKYIICSYRRLPLTIRTHNRVRLLIYLCFSSLFWIKCYHTTVSVIMKFYLTQKLYGSIDHHTYHSRSRSISSRVFACKGVFSDTATSASSWCSQQIQVRHLLTCPWKTRSSPSQFPLCHERYGFYRQRHRLYRLWWSRSRSARWDRLPRDQVWIE